MALTPDIAILQELRDVDLPMFDGVGSTIWAGPEGKKGVAIVGLNGWTLEQHAPLTERWLVPVVASRGAIRLNLVGVWAADTDGYVAPAIRALGALEAFVQEQSCIVAGDFNANVIWDKGRSPERRFGEFIGLMGRCGLTSAWHHAWSETPGAETGVTIHHMWSEAKRHHVDYAFVSRDLLAGMTDVSLGTYADWVKAGLSDHVPLSASFSLGNA